MEKKVNETKKKCFALLTKKSKKKKKKKILSKVNNQCDCMDTGGQRFVMKILENAWHYKEEEWNGKQFLMDWRGTVLKILHHLQARICKVSVCNFSPLNHGSWYYSLEDGKSKDNPYNPTSVGILSGRLSYNCMHPSLWRVTQGFTYCLYE